MFRISRTKDATSTKDIIYAIVTNNILQVKNFVTKNNINNILDEITGFTALQYAISSPNINIDIIKYILDLGANPKEKIKNQNIDSFDLAINYNKKYLFEYFTKFDEEKINKLNDELKTCHYKILKIDETNKYLLESIEGYNNKIIKLNDEIKTKDNEIISLKRKYDDVELAFTNLLKKTKK
jgi:ankyrin repeat protein